jgi:hypothetical protein
MNGLICLSNYRKRGSRGYLSSTTTAAASKADCTAECTQLVSPSLSYSGVATAGCLEAPSRCDRPLPDVVVVIPALVCPYGIQVNEWWPVIGCVRLYS